ncbi:MAG TPA: CBS domain-containing protein [Anaerolineales bacterium]|nr:CBS domain-containing protein [Anaerolineales bacterium]
MIESAPGFWSGLILIKTPQFLFAIARRHKVNSSGMQIRAKNRNLLVREPKRVYTLSTFYKRRAAMATVRDMIRKKGYDVFTIAPDATVFEALNLMAEHNIGALLVMSGEEINGIVSERDCIRKVDVLGRSAKDTKISEIMTSNVITVEADQPLEDCLGLMIDKNIRHLPVCEGKKLLGLLSVRDVLREVVEVQQMMLSQLERYITGGGR